MQFKLQKKTLYIQKIVVFSFACSSPVFQEMKINGILFLTKYPDTMKCHTVHKSVCRHFMTCQIPWEGKPRNPSKPPQLYSLVPCNTTLLLVYGLLTGPTSEAIQHLNVFTYWKAQVLIYSPEFAPLLRASSFLKLP